MSDQPIRAERVFDLAHTDEGWMLEATATDYTYPGPICYNPVPPWTADEWEAMKGLTEKAEPKPPPSQGPFATVTLRITGFPGHEGPRSFPTHEHAMEAVRRFGAERVGRYLRHPSMHEGFHAFRPGTMPRDSYFGYGAKPVLAEVELFGRVVEYERGYRAEKMRIEKLTVMPRNEEAVSDLENRYHSDVEVRKWQTSDERSESMRSSHIAGFPIQFQSGPMFLTGSGTLSQPEKRSWFRRTWDAVSETEPGVIGWYLFGYFVAMWTVAASIGSALP